MKWLAKWVPLTMATLFTASAGAMVQSDQVQPYPQQTYPQQEPQPDQQPLQAFAPAELDQMLAPIALYPDNLLSQILMASTFPDQVEQAAAWSRANPNVSGEEAVRAVQNQPWDPSVISLVAFPQVLAQMSDHRDWTFRLGQAYMTNSSQMMDSIQGLRARADQNGNLQSNDTQIVEQQGGGDYTIQPPNPEVMNVPYYDPRVAYGQWPYPSYQPVYWDPWPAYWGAGIVLGAAFWYGGMDWHHGYVSYSHYRPWYYHGNSWHGGQRWAHNGGSNNGHNVGWNGHNSNGGNGGNSRWQADRGNWDRRAQNNGGQTWRGGGDGQRGQADGNRWQGNGGQMQRGPTNVVNPATRLQNRAPSYQMAQTAAQRPTWQGQQGQAAQRTQGEVRTYRGASRNPIVREAGVSRGVTSGRQVAPQRSREFAGNPAARSSEARSFSRSASSSSARSAPSRSESHRSSESRSGGGRHGRD